MFEKILEKKIHAIRYFPAGIICGPLRGSFAVRDHLRFNLGIISGLGIICGRGSFAALYSTYLFFGISDAVFSDAFPRACWAITEQAK